jgi:hypothetical protein
VCVGVACENLGGLQVLSTSIVGTKSIIEVNNSQMFSAPILTDFDTTQNYVSTLEPVNAIYQGSMQNNLDNKTRVVMSNWLNSPINSYNSIQLVIPTGVGAVSQGTCNGDFVSYAGSAGSYQNTSTGTYISILYDCTACVENTKNGIFMTFNLTINNVSAYASAFLAVADYNLTVINSKPKVVSIAGASVNTLKQYTLHYIKEIYNQNNNTQVYIGNNVLVDYINKQFPVDLSVVSVLANGTLFGVLRQYMDNLDYYSAKVDTQLHILSVRNIGYLITSKSKVYGWTVAGIILGGLVIQVTLYSCTSSNCKNIGSLTYLGNISPAFNAYGSNNNNGAAMRQWLLDTSLKYGVVPNAAGNPSLVLECNTGPPHFLPAVNRPPPGFRYG